MREIDYLAEELRKLDYLCNDDNELISVLSVQMPKFPPMNYGFFPGGNGLFRGEEANEFPFGGTLILGLNYGGYGGFIDDVTEALWTTDERNGATWKGLRHILPESGIDLGKCFFTNAWPFLHKGKKNVASPGKWLNKKNTKLTQECGAFFKKTFLLMRPSLVVTLGWGAAEFLRRVSPANFGPTELGKFSDNWALRSGEAVYELESVRAVCFSIKHPAWGGSNRRPVDPSPEELEEIKTLRKAKKKAETLDCV